jgi:protein import protein ZIM17
MFGTTAGAGSNGVDEMGGGDQGGGEEEEETLRLSTGSVPADAAVEGTAGSSATLGQLGGDGTAKGQPRMQITFTCTVCDERSTKTFTKHSYTKGVVLIRCPGCQNLHLIADNLGWFQQDGTNVNIEDIMRDQGEEVIGPDGVVELDASALHPTA